MIRDAVLSVSILLFNAWGAGILQEATQLYVHGLKIAYIFQNLV